MCEFKQLCFPIPLLQRARSTDDLETLFGLKPSVRALSDGGNIWRIQACSFDLRSPPSE